MDVITLFQRVFINIYVTKKYKQVNFSSNNQLNVGEKKSIKSRIKAMFIHKIGSFVINGTDSVVISATSGLGIVVVGLYTNYLSIITTVTSLFEQVYKGITSSFGDLAVNEKESTQENVFNIISFSGFIMYGLTSIGLYFLLSPFIKMCFGAKFELDNIVVLFMVVNFYFSGIIAGIDMIKEATGQFLVDKYVPLIQSVINLIVSIVLAHYIGLLGVILGTTISYITVSLWNRPYIAYKYIFKSSTKYFIIQQIKYIITVVLTILVLNIIFKYFIISSLLLSLLIKGIICVVVFIIMVIVIFHSSDEYSFIKHELKKYISR